MNKKTVVVTLCDVGYFEKAKLTIRDIRSVGAWTGDLVVITVGFSLTDTFRDYYGITEKQFERIDLKEYLRKIEKPFPDGDGREFSKTVQWEKLHVFDPFFQKWEKVVFLDAGLRLLAPICDFMVLDCTGRILAHHDNGAPESARRGSKRFASQMHIASAETAQDLAAEFGPEIFNSTDYFLNCLWVYDTSILSFCSKDDMLSVMRRYPIWKSNEMGVMNALLHFRHRIWKAFPLRSPLHPERILFEWSELTQDPPGTWRDYCALKYPVTIRSEDT